MGKRIKININLYKTQACMTYSTPWLWNLCIKVIVFYAELNLFKGYSFTNQPLISAHPSTWAQLFCPSKNNVNMVSVYGKLDQSCYVPYLVFIFAKPFCKKTEPILRLPLGAFSLTAVFWGGLPTMSYIQNATPTFIQCSVSKEKTLYAPTFSIFTGS